MLNIKRILNNTNINKEIDNLIKNWKELMISLGMYNIKLETYTLKDVIKTNSGFRCKIYIPNGLMIDDIELSKEYIEAYYDFKFSSIGNDDKKYLDAEFTLNC